MLLERASVRTSVVSLSRYVSLKLYSVLESLLSSVALNGIGWYSKGRQRIDDLC